MPDILKIFIYIAFDCVSFHLDPYIIMTHEGWYYCYGNSFGVLCVFQALFTKLECTQLNIKMITNYLWSKNYCYIYKCKYSSI